MRGSGREAGKGLVDIDAEKAEHRRIAPRNALGKRLQRSVEAGCSLFEFPCAVMVPVKTPAEAFAFTEIRIIGADGTGDRVLYRLTTADGKPGWCVCNDGLTIRRY